MVSRKSEFEAFSFAFISWTGNHLAYFLFQLIVLATKLYLIPDNSGYVFMCLQIEKELQSFKQISGPDPNYNDMCFSGAGTYVCSITR